MGGYAAVVLAGGAGRRLGGVRKPLIEVGGQRMLDRVLAAVADATPRIVVAPPGLDVPAGVRRVSEEPPGGGPVAALAAGLAALAEGVGAITGPCPAADGEATDGGAADGEVPDVVAVLAADLPFLSADAVQALRDALGQSTVDGVVFVDGQGRRQTLCGVWHTGTLRAALLALPDHQGTALRRLLEGLDIGEVSYDVPGPPPWYDCDSPEDLNRAEEWT
jgi:molybdopterin-guanine dinucleotide biosynthesis protein A